MVPDGEVDDLVVVYAGGANMMNGNGDSVD